MHGFNFMIFKLFNSCRVKTVLRVQMYWLTLSTYNKFIVHAHFLLFLSHNTMIMHAHFVLISHYFSTHKIVLFITAKNLSFLEVISFFVRFKIMQSSINSIISSLTEFVSELKCTHRARTFLQNTLLFYTTNSSYMVKTK